MDSRTNSTCCNEEAIHYIDNKYICSRCNRRCLIYNKNAFRKFILISFAIICLSFVFLNNTKLNNYKAKYFEKKSNEQFKDVELNDSSISVRLIELGCILPNVALAQIKQESGHYKSNLTYTHKNIAGIMKGNNYKKYTSYDSCLIDYIRIQDMYLNQINKKYAEDTNYIYKLKYIKWKEN
jgi:hypothetical protein